MTETTTKHSEQPLSGRTVVLAGPRTQLNDYVTELEKTGASVLVCPDVETAGAESYERLDEALEHLYGYDWLLFTSEAGIVHFLGRLQGKGLEASALDDLKVCAIGEVAQRRLRDNHVHVDIAPATPDTTAVFSELERFVGGLGELRGLNFLSPRSTATGDSLTRALRDAGARVDTVCAYRVRSTAAGDLGRTAAMLPGAADCLVLLNPAAASNLAVLFDAHDLGESLGEITIVAATDLAAKAADEHGLGVDCVAANSDAVALAQSVTDCLVT